MPVVVRSIWFSLKCFFLISYPKGPSSALAVHRWAARAEPPTLLSFLENALSGRERTLPKSRRNPDLTGIGGRNQSRFCNGMGLSFHILPGQETQTGQERSMGRVGEETGSMWS